jgi:putative acetyltransferase
MTAGPGIRPIDSCDDRELARVLRAVMVEFGALDAEDSADRDLDSMSAAYGGDRSAYFVAERDGELLGGAGITPFASEPEEVCVLSKMYLSDRARGHGFGRALLEACLGAARDLGYRRCYLETMPSMTRARRLYEAAGFTPRESALPGACASRCSTYYECEL